MSKKCKNCNKYLSRIPGYKKIIKNEEEAKVFSDCLNKTVIVNDIFCKKCRLIPYVNKKASTSKCAAFNEVSLSIKESVEELATREVPEETYVYSEDSDNSSDSDFTYKYHLSDDFIEVPLQRVASTHKYCIICQKTTDLMTICLETRIQLFIKKLISIPTGNRCCSMHLIGNYFYKDDLLRLRIVSNTSNVEKTELTLFFNTLSNKSQSSIFDRMNELDMSEDQVKTLTGISWENILNLRSLLTSMRDTRTRSVTQALIIFLFKLKTGNSNETIASIFGLPYAQQVSEYFTQILTSFEKEILPYSFRYNAVSRQQLIANTSDNAKKLLNVNENQLILIVDDTYVRHQKSKNNYFQRRSYSGQKKTHLCKPFAICTTNGFVLDFAGPFSGTLNDATIMKVVLENPSGLKKLLLPNDIFIVDRGFRDVVEFLNDKGFNVLMPAFKGNKLQLSTEEANISRNITKIRWVVEAVHGNIAQKYKLLHYSFDNKMLPKLELLCKTIGFLHNTYEKRLHSDSSLSNIIVQYMKSRMDIENTLSQEVQSQHWNRKKNTLKCLTASELLDFPRLTEDQLKILFTGSYQFSQAISYLAEIMDDQNNLSVQYVKSAPNFIKAEVKSRHINRKVYRIYIHYIPKGNDYNSILRYCCDCPNCKRTVGCCSHVAAIIYYLSYGRYLSRIVRPAEVLTKLFATQSVPIVINYNSDDN
ncbi:uncharacterized protein LOC103575255 [Microplitis demolitor]|uniref:uncharacterized protein LOC103575255 n=1 Tax=Microplitis demolitor TaxID=69319 RepID=UPI00235B642E|nr:uncharacterized protein LOC103575255 [Microplitis demolitor]